MPKVLLTGWDGAAWSRIHPLLDSGALPELSKMVERGVMGDLAALSPLCPPLLWTSLTTGRFADAHGVLDTVEPDPITGGVRPLTRASVAAPQIWDILRRKTFDPALSDGRQLIRLKVLPPAFPMDSPTAFPEASIPPRSHQPSCRCVLKLTNGRATICNCSFPN